MTAEPLVTPAPLAARHPLEAWRPTLAALSRELAPGLHVELEPDAVAVTLRSVPTGAALWAAADVLGRPLPTAPGTWATVGGDDTHPTRAHRLGPDEWLVTDPSPAALADPGARERALRDAVRHHGGAAVDVSAQRTGLRLRGCLTRELLAFGCSLDLRPRTFRPGSCAQTLVWQAPVLLAAAADGDVVLLVRTSFAGHLVARLLDAAQDLRPDPALPPH